MEVFGGYSYLSLTQQPRLNFKSATLNGWKASVKLNFTPRIGMLADFSGHYGQLVLTPYLLSDISTSRRQHTYLFGPEVRILKNRRVGLNVRALIGVAQTNNSALPRRVVAPITNNVFAAAFGGSVDYRITDRLSYRIIEPELFVMRFGSGATDNWQHYNLRISSGIVFTSGKSSYHGSSGRRFSFGVIGGAALTDAFGHENSGFVFLPGGGGIQPTRSRAYSTLKDYAIGAMVDVGPLWRGLSVEIDALYRPMNLTMAGVRPDGSLHSISPATVVTWELPVLAKYRFGSGSVKPFIEAGPSFRSSGNLNDAEPSTYGGTAGLGVETRFLKLRIAPVLRYTHWAADPDFATSRTKRNQVEALIGLSF